jgi:hypothetical protein
MNPEFIKWLQNQTFTYLVNYRLWWEVKKEYNNESLNWYWHDITKD